MSYQAEEEEEEGVPQQVADLAQASVPQSMRGIRACKRCGILKTLDQFVNEGCENCPFLDMVRHHHEKAERRAESQRRQQCRQ
jgi:transcription elongation factor SPT4